MNPTLRLLTRADLPFADAVRASAGWNQTLADWERLLALAPDGCFLAEWDGAPAGTATTTIYGRDLAWIGMVLVHPDFRRRGIGRALLERCLEHLRTRRVRGIKLDATPLGKTVYDQLGFHEEWTLTRWQREPVAGIPATDPRVRAWLAADLDALEPLDAAAFGASRRGLLQSLTCGCRAALVMESDDGRPVGYGLARPGSRALYLGPAVAASADIGERLVDALIARGSGERMFWDIPDPNTAAVAHARQHGFTPQRTLTRMYLGENRAPGDPRRQFAIAGPELG